MKKLLFLLLLVPTIQASAQTVHDYASVEFSPAIRKLGVFSTAFPAKIIELKTIHMNKLDQDIISFFQEVQQLEKEGWEMSSQNVLALDRGVHTYVWIMRKPKP